MPAKINLNGPYREFHCPGCGFDHGVNGAWTWNGSLERPSFQPSVKAEICGKVCHFYVTDGKIQFCTDCTAHQLGGQTLDLPDWEEMKEEKPAMAEKKEFKRGDKVIITAPQFDGVPAEVLYDMIDGRLVCVVAGSHHPSGHSQEGSLVLFTADQLKLQEAAPVKEVSL
jgi:hypothetical protein